MTLPPTDITVTLGRAFGNMKTALAELEQACDGVVQQLNVTARQSAAAIEAADKRIADASAHTEAAVEQVRRDAQLQMDDLRESIQRLRADLLVERGLRQASEAAAAAARQVVPQRAEEKVEPAKAAAVAPTTEVATSKETEAVALNFDAREYAQQLLDHLESVYQADEAAGIPPSDQVERLVANLLYASDVFTRRAGSAGARDSDAFQRQLAIALDAKGGTSFGRHLAVAAFEHNQRRKPGGHAQVA